MPGGPSREQLEKELEQEVALLRELAMKSTDALTVAKAIAASDPTVHTLIVDRLMVDEHLAEIFAFSTKGELTEIQVFFRFTPKKEGIRLVDAGLLAFVDPGRGEVIGTVDPFVLQPEHRAARPFVALSALNPAKFAANAQASKAVTDKQQAFFESLGLTMMMRSDGSGGIATVRDTFVNTSTWSGNPRRGDDSTNEYTDDYVDCAPGIFVA